MSSNPQAIRTALRGLIPVALLVAPACRSMSEEVRDPAAGRNSGFEHARSGLPVNWIVYSPATIPTGSYELHFDRGNAKEGEQSLRFDVQACSPEGGRYSPGIAQEYPATPGATYALRFWIQNEGCDWVVSFGGVDAKTGDYESIESSQADSYSWQRIEREYFVPPRCERIRFELSIRSPGRLWIDDVRIEPSMPEGRRGD